MSVNFTLKKKKKSIVKKLRIIKSEKFICLRLNQVVDTWFLGETFWNETETALHSHCAPWVKVFGKKGIQFTVHRPESGKTTCDLTFTP